MDAKRLPDEVVTQLLLILKPEKAAAAPGWRGSGALPLFSGESPNYSSRPAASLMASMESYFWEYRVRGAIRVSPMDTRS